MPVAAFVLVGQRFSPIDEAFETTQHAREAVAHLHPNTRFSETQQVDGDVTVVVFAEQATFGFAKTIHA